MLTAATASGGAPKQVIVKSSTAGQVMYVVPAGKTFTGTIRCTENATPVTINENEMQMVANASWEVTLLEGTVVKKGSGSYNLYLLGIEQ